MDDTIVSRLMAKHRNSTNSLKESLAAEKLHEAEEDEEDINSGEEIPEEEEEMNIDSETTADNSSENATDTEEEDSDSPVSLAKRMSGSSPAKRSASEDDIGEEESPEEVPEEKPETKSNDSSHVNPLDNPHAVMFGIGDEVTMKYSNGASSGLSGTVDGYDKEGFYRIRWENGSTTSGITDIALAESNLSNTSESCVCGGQDFVTEGKNIVCDRCGRVIRESLDIITPNPKKKKMKNIIRAEQHPVSTSVKPSISETIKNALKSIHEEWEDDEDDLDDEEDEDPFKSLKSLSGEFWTRQSEMEEDIEELGYDIYVSNSEYIEVGKEGTDSSLVIPISGTSRTMILDFDRAKRYNN